MRLQGRLTRLPPGTPRAVIFTEGSKRWGMGHLQRCEAFARELALRKWTVEWRVCGDGVAREFLRSRAGRRETWWENACPDRGLQGALLGVVDSYHAPLRVYRDIAAQIPRCLYLDDEARLAYPKGWVVNSLPHAQDLPWALGLEATLLAGPAYHAMRPEFHDGFRRRVRGCVERILVVMGGTDARGLSPLVTEEARKVYPRALIRLVVPDDAQRARWGGLENGATRLLGQQDASGMRSLMEWADLGISGSGQTLYEVCRMGLPVIAVGVADNQRRLVDCLREAQVLLFAGWWNDASLAPDLRAALRRAGAVSERERLARSGPLLVDGCGVERVLSALGCDRG